MGNELEKSVRTISFKKIAWKIARGVKIKRHNTLFFYYLRRDASTTVEIFESLLTRNRNDIITASTTVEIFESLLTGIRNMGGDNIYNSRNF